MAKKKKVVKKPVAKKKAAPAKKATPVKKAKTAKPSKVAKAVKAKTPVQPNKSAVIVPKAMKQIANLDLQPLDDRLIVEVLAHETKTAGGLYIPDSALDRDMPLKGKVVAVGRGRTNKKGQIRPMDVSKGDTVLFAKFAGSPMKIDGRDLCILREAEILGIVE